MNPSRTESFYRYAGEIAEDLDTPVIAVLSDAPPTCRRDQSDELEQFTGAEALDPVIRALRASTRSVHVAGISGDVGRDALSLSLARVLAETGRRILVVDADADGPALAEPGALGITDILAGDASITQTVVPSPGYEGMMAFLPIGSRPGMLEAPGAVEPLVRVLEDLRPSYDVMLVSAPCLDRRGKVHPVAIACEVVLLVLSPGVVSRDRIRRNFLQLWGVEAPIEGLVTLGVPDVLAEVVREAHAAAAGAAVTDAHVNGRDHDAELDEAPPAAAPSEADTAAGSHGDDDASLEESEPEAITFEDVSLEEPDPTEGVEPETPSHEEEPIFDLDGSAGEDAPARGDAELQDIEASPHDLAASPHDLAASPHDLEKAPSGESEAAPRDPFDVERPATAGSGRDAMSFIDELPEGELPPRPDREDVVSIESRVDLPDAEPRAPLETPTGEWEDVPAFAAHERHAPGADPHTPDPDPRTPGPDPHEPAAPSAEETFSFADDETSPEPDSRRLAAFDEAEHDAGRRVSDSEARDDAAPDEPEEQTMPDPSSWDTPSWETPKERETAHAGARAPEPELFASEAGGPHAGEESDDDTRSLDVIERIAFEAVHDRRASSRGDGGGRDGLMKKLVWGVGGVAVVAAIALFVVPLLIQGSGRDDSPRIGGGQDVAASTPGTDDIPDEVVLTRDNIDDTAPPLAEESGDAQAGEPGAARDARASDAGSTSPPVATGERPTPARSSGTDAPRTAPKNAGSGAATASKPPAAAPPPETTPPAKTTPTRSEPTPRAAGPAGAPVMKSARFAGQPPFFAVHITSFRSTDRAAIDAERLGKLTGHGADYIDFDLTEGDNAGRWYRVIVGRFADLDTAKREARSFVSQGFTTYAKVFYITAP